MILRGARVFDGTGRPAQQGLAVVVEDGHIAEFANGAVGSMGDARTVDLTGCTLLPGLLDLHVHLGPGGRVRARPTPPPASGPRATSG